MDRGPRELAETLRSFEARRQSLELFARFVETPVDGPGEALHQVMVERASGPDPASRGKRVLQPAALGDKLEPLPQSKVRQMVIRLLTESLAYPGGNEERVGDAGALADDVIRLLGPDAAWWINIIERYFGGCDSWDAVTEHTFDGCLVGQGRGLSFVILAADED